MSLICSLASEDIKQKRQTGQGEEAEVEGWGAELNDKPILSPPPPPPLLGGRGGGGGGGRESAYRLTQ